jgi:hypothetical protein
LTLENIRSNRIKYRLRLSTSNSAESPVVRGVILSYLPLPEPNWMWEMVVVASRKQQLLDKSVATVDAPALMAYLENLYRTQSLVQFTELNGSVWTTSGKGVLVYDFQLVPAITGDPSSEYALEGDARIVLLEAVESY